MGRIGDIYRYGFLLLFFCIPSLLFGQKKSPSVQATVSNTTLFTGQRLELTITISGDFRNVNRPTLPNFPGFKLLNNTPSISRSISTINGVTKSSYAYNYYLVPTSKGRKRIPPVSIKVDGKVYKTDPINIKVENRSKSSQNQSQNSGSNIYLRLNISKRHPVTGEQLIANVELYFKKGLEVQSYQPVPGWKARGFWKESLNTNQRPSVQSTVINGVRFRKARLMQFALFPTKSGELTISPYQVKVTIQSISQQGSPFNNFFGSPNSSQQTIKLKTNPITITVDSLPKADTSRYIGAVGDFNISRSINTKKAKVGQSIQIKTTIRGSGNIPLIDKPRYKFPSGLEVYQPQENSNINRSNHRISGTKTFTDVLVARSPGTFKIPQKTLSYYNPQKKKMIATTLPAQTVKVTGSPGTAETSKPSSSFSLEPITGLASWVSPHSQLLYRYWWFWAGMFIPLAVLALAYWQRSYRYKMNTDRAFARSQKAVQKARGRLDEALENAENGETKQAYNSLQKAIEGFISDRLGLPEAGLSIEQYVSALEEQKVNAELVKNVRMLLNKCATINYAPDRTAELLKSHVGLGESIINKLRKEL